MLVFAVIVEGPNITGLRHEVPLLDDVATEKPLSIAVKPFAMFIVDPNSA